VLFARRLTDLRPPLVDEMAFREFVNVLADLALQNKCDKESSATEVSYLCGQVGAIVATVQGIDPVRAAKLKTSPRSSILRIRQHQFGRS